MRKHKPPKKSYQVSAMHETFAEVQDIVMSVPLYLTKWGLSKAEMMTEAFLGFHHAWRKFDPERGKAFNQYLKETLWFLPRANVRDMMKNEWALSRKRVSGESVGGSNEDTRWEDNVATEEEENDIVDRIDRIGVDGTLVISLIIDPPKGLLKMYDKWSNYGSATVRYAWTKAVREFLTKGGWSLERVREAFHSITESLTTPLED